MPDPVLEMLAAGVVPSATLAATSRYKDVGVSTWQPTAPPGEESLPVPFLRRRLCPGEDRFSVLYVVRVVEGDRRDRLGQQHLGDPELWWQLADADGVIDPDDLTRTIGRSLRVTLPVDVPGVGDG